MALDFGPTKSMYVDRGQKEVSKILSDRYMNNFLQTEAMRKEAAALEAAINADSNLSGANKSVSVKWTGDNYEFVSNTGRQTYDITDTTVASVEIIAIDSTIENNLKLSKANGGTESINGYQLGIVGAGSVSASQITFPDNSQNTTSKTSLGLNTAIANIKMPPILSFNHK